MSDKTFEDLLFGAATALESQWCEKDIETLRVHAQAIKKLSNPLSVLDNVQYDTLCTILAGEENRYCELTEPDAVDVLRAIITDRNKAYEQLNIQLNKPVREFPMVTDDRNSEG